MNGFFSWLKPENKMLRWLFLILISIILVCYAISTILVNDSLNIENTLKIGISFILGCVGIVYSIISIQKRTLELLIKKTDKRDNVQSLIYNKKVYEQGPKIVVIGGGSGLNNVLRGLKKYTNNITAIVSVSDYENEKTESSRILNALPLEDIEESIIALSDNEYEMEDLLKHQFSYGSLKSLSFGDIYFLAMQNIYSDFEKSVEKSNDILNMTGKVLPVTQDKFEICAELSDGTVVKGRDEISTAQDDRICNIKRVYISPSNCKIANGVADAIKQADAIVIGPGSLYTNVIPNLLVKGVAKAIRESKGIKIYVSNIMTDPGQTSNYSLSDHIKAIRRHLGDNMIDYCIYDTGEVVPEYIRKYNLKGSELVEQDIQMAKGFGIQLVKRDMATVFNGKIIHDPDSVGSAIIDLVCEDLKFNDKQNSPEYLFLQQKMKFRKSNPNKKKKYQKEKINNGRKSKFYSKYKDRIVSLKESDEKIKQKMENEYRGNQILKRVNGMRMYENDIKKIKNNEKNKYIR